MAKIVKEKQGNIAVLTLTNGVTNAISPELVDEFSKSLREIRKEASGLLLCGGEKFFSIGFDLPALITMNRAELSDFFYKFNTLALDLYTLPFPSVSALSGHAIAGGSILAIACDFRFAASRTGKTGLNEIRLGLPVPYLADMILRQIVGDRAATGMLYGGGFISLTAGAEIGLVDEICPVERLKQASLEKIAGFAVPNPRAFSAIKANRCEAIKNDYEKNGRVKNEFFIDCWFSEATQEALLAASRKF
ncbi:MAG: enoyl-CoA hydratase/isomerase family protein [Syntrophales bacterium]